MTCRSGQLTESGIDACLGRTDFSGHHTELRGTLGWHIAYGYKVRDTTCCALQPRSDLLAKRGDLPLLKNELLQRIDILEKAGQGETPDAAIHEVLVRLRQSDACYAALMDLYHDLNRAIDHPRRR